MAKDLLEDMCAQILESKGWETQLYLKFERAKMPTALSAFINLADVWTINIIASPDAEQKLDATVKEMGLRDLIPNPVYDALYFATSHEWGHWKYCPYNDYGHLAIQKGVREFVEKRLVREETIAQMTARGANIVEDIINNAILSYEDEAPADFVKGFTAYYLNNAREMQPNVHLMKRKFLPEFSIFLNTNLAMTQADPAFYRKVRSYLKDSTTSLIDRDTRAIAEILLGNPEAARRAVSFSMDEHDKEKNSYALKDSLLWYQKSYDIAEIIYRYLKEPPANGSNSLSDMLDKAREALEKQQQNQQQQSPQKGKKGKQKPDNPSEYDLTNDFYDPEGKGSPNPTPPDAKPQKKEDGGNGKETIFGNKYENIKDSPFPQNDTPETESENEPVKDGQGYRYPDSLWEMMKKYPLKFAKKLADGSIFDPKLPNFEELDALYRNRAAPLVINIRDDNREDPEAPLRYIERVNADPNELRPGRIDWGRTRFLGNGDFQMFERELPLNLDIPVETTPGGMPDLLWIVDSSESMGWNPEQGIGCYDSVARIVYSAHLSLEKSGKGFYINYGLINFSSTARFTGWVPYQELDKVHQELFKYQNGGTWLHPNSIKQAVQEAKDVFVALMVSDGDFNILTNENEIAKQIKELESGGNYFALFQIGPMSGFANKLRAQGSPVFEVNGPKDMYELVVEIEKSTWGGMQQ